MWTAHSSHASHSAHESWLHAGRAVAQGLTVLVVTGTALGAVAYLAHLINTSWTIL